MYRVDRRTFAVNDIIIPDNNYQNNLDDSRRAVEDILSSRKPSNIEGRDIGLFIFERLSDALRYSSNMSNSLVYKVSTTNATILYHRGDFNWVEILLGENLSDDSKSTIADSYWSGQLTYSRCVEMRISEAVIIQVIIGSEEQRTNLRNELNNLNGNPELLNLYYQNIRLL